MAALRQGTRKPHGMRTRRLEQRQRRRHHRRSRSGDVPGGWPGPDHMGAAPAATATSQRSRRPLDAVVLALPAALLFGRHERNGCTLQPPSAIVSPCCRLSSASRCRCTSSSRKLTRSPASSRSRPRSRKTSCGTCSAGPIRAASASPSRRRGWTKGSIRCTTRLCAPASNGSPPTRIFTTAATSFSSRGRSARWPRRCGPCSPRCSGRASTGMRSPAAGSICAAAFRTTRRRRSPFSTICWPTRSSPSGVSPRPCPTSPRSASDRRSPRRSSAPCCWCRWGWGSTGATTACGARGGNFWTCSPGPKRSPPNGTRQR